MHQDANWYEDRRQPRGFCVRWGPPLPKSIFGPCLLRPKGCMDQDATWYRGMPRPRRHCVRWGTSSPSSTRGRIAQFSAHVYCGQMVGWIKLALGMEVGLVPGHIALDGDPAPHPKKRGEPPIFGPFWAAVCKMVRRMLSHRCLSVCLSVLSVLSCLSCPVCL